MADFVDSDDWRTKCKNVTETFAEARKKTMFIDVRFLVGQSSSARYFSAHKMVLACGSPVFEAMFFGQLAEKKDPITVPDDDPDAFEIMLQHLYGECIIFPSIVVACKSYSVADKYLITELQTKSVNFIKAAGMDDENFWGVIEGNLLTNKYIEEKFRRYIELSADRLIKCDEFLQVPDDILKIFLQMEVMNVSEYELLSSVTKWCLKKFTKDTMWKTQDLLQHIRFSVLTPKEFCLFTEKFPDVLDASTSLKILKHLSDPSTYDLPFWCSKNKAIRKPASPAPLSLNSNSSLSSINFTVKPNLPEAIPGPTFMFGKPTKSDSSPVHSFKFVGIP